jgi:surface polysaccharide O-acyltransferase-like enzyme
MTRIQSVDSFRVFAIIAVIGLHTATYSGSATVDRSLDVATVLNNLDRFAVPLFFVLSGYFWANRCRTGPDYLERSFSASKRTLLIFIAWSCLYLVAPVGDAFQMYGVTGPAKEFYWKLSAPAGFLNALLEGPKVHLWFLPALALITLISGSLLRWNLRWILTSVAVILYLIGLAGGAYASTAVGFHSNFTFRNGPFFGLIFFVSGYWLQGIDRTRAWLPIGILLVIAGVALQLSEVKWLHDNWGVSMRQDFVLGTYPFGMGVALIALSDARGLQMRKLASIGQLVLGVYASHFLFVDLLRPVDELHHGQPLWDVGYIGIVFIMSLIVTYGLSKASLTRKFVM